MEVGEVIILYSPASKTFIFSSRTDPSSSEINCNSRDAQVPPDSAISDITTVLFPSPGHLGRRVTKVEVFFPPCCGYSTLALSIFVLLAAWPSHKAPLGLVRPQDARLCIIILCTWTTGIPRLSTEFFEVPDNNFLWPLFKECVWFWLFSPGFR